jgi:uncharacterized GH25 family protein
VLARTRANEAGEFELENIGIPPRFAESIAALQRREAGAELLAWADGKALAWKDVSELASAVPVALVLGPEAETRGILKAPDGKGISNARVSITGITSARKNIDEAFRSPGDANLLQSEIEPAALTDSEGRFAIQHAPVDCRMSVVIEHPAYARESLIIDTGTDRGLSEIAVGDSRQLNPKKRPMKRVPLEMSLRPARHVRVQVTDADGKPVTKGVVKAVAGRELTPALLSAEGEAVLRTSGFGEQHFGYSADPLEPALSTWGKVDVGKDGALLVLKLPEPRWLIGKVVNPDTSEGVAGAFVYYSPTGDDGARNTANSAAVSGKNGEFRIPVVSGSGCLGIFGTVHNFVVPEYAPIRRIGQPFGIPLEIPATGPLEPVTLKLSRGLVIRGVVSDKEGKPVAGVTVVAHNNGEPFRSDMTKTDADGKYELAALPPRVETYVVAFDDAGNASAKLGGLPKHPLDEARQEEMNFKLQPGVVLSGQAYQNSRPRAGVKLRLIKIVSESMGRSLRLGETVTDAEGKYRLAGLVAGDQYQIEIADPDGLVAAGWRHQSPYNSFAPEGTEAALPPMHLSALTQRLAGVVVDRKGKPLAGIHVVAQMPNRDSIPWSPGRPPSNSVTDAAGEFELQRLPAEEILLIAYAPNKTPGIIQFPSQIRPRIGDDKIRILIDTELTQDVEDLDKPGNGKP